MWDSVLLEMLETSCCSNTQTCRKEKQERDKSVLPVTEEELMSALYLYQDTMEQCAGSVTELAAALKVYLEALERDLALTRRPPPAVV